MQEMERFAPFYFHKLRITQHYGYEEVWDGRPAVRNSETIQPSLWPDSASQHQATWSKETLPVCKIRLNKTLRFPLRLRIMIEEGLVKQYYHYANMKRNEIIHLRSQLNKDDDVESDELISDDDL